MAIKFGTYYTLILAAIVLLAGKFLVQHIRWLREKIETVPETPQRIITVRGAGYRFEG